MCTILGENIGLSVGSSKSPIKEGRKERKKYLCTEAIQYLV